MKKFLYLLGCMFSVWAGMWLMLIAKISDSPARQGTLAILSAILFTIALCLAGVGNSLTWKGKRKE